MQLQNRFRVALPVEDTWRLLTDLPKVAGCLPGATVDEAVDGAYQGRIATRVGPISARYRGTASFREHDAVSHRAVIEASGREEKGNGSAQALITAVLKPDGDGTLVDVSTELTISGRAAQFGRSLLAEVSNSMVDEFLRRLEAMIAQDGGAGAPRSTVPAVPAVPAAPAGSADRRHADEADQLDVLSTIVLPLVRKHARDAAIAVAIGAAGYLLGRSRGGRRARGSRVPALYLLPHALPTERPLATA
jgi:carbon monoxide dehydrogenase subunit G